jgi:hypothetical protein
MTPCGLLLSCPLRVLGVCLFAACGGGQPAPQSPAAARSPVGGPCSAGRTGQAGLVCEQSACRAATRDETQKAIDDAVEQGEQYGGR